MDKREQILHIALELFYSRGYDAVGVQEIAEKSGVSKPTLYYYFKSKYGLLEQLLKEGCTRFVEGLEQAGNFTGDLRGTLWACARVFADFAEQARCALLCADSRERWSRFSRRRPGSWEICTAGRSSSVWALPG